jgi:hypothetical protein
MVHRDREAFMQRLMIARALGAPLPEPMDAAEHALAQLLLASVDQLLTQGHGLDIPARLPD